MTVHNAGEIAVPEELKGNVTITNIRNLLAQPLIPSITGHGVILSGLWSLAWLAAPSK
jgi:hypothetical protein